MQGTGKYHILHSSVAQNRVESSVAKDPEYDTLVVQEMIGKTANKISSLGILVHNHECKYNYRPRRGSKRTLEVLMNHR